jgi:trehalose 6-phosphate synthase
MEMREDVVRRLVVVSNRLPVVLSSSDGNWRSEPGSGGLVTALAPVLRNRGGLWIGWPGAAIEDGVQEALEQAVSDAGYSLVAVPLEAGEVNRYYRGFSNEIIWPLFHDLQTRCNFDPEYWNTYRDVNRKFADVTAAHTDDGDFIWVHDYHLMLRPGGLPDNAGSPQLRSVPEDARERHRDARAWPRVRDLSGRHERARGRFSYWYRLPAVRAGRRKPRSR